MTKRVVQTGRAVFSRKKSAFQALCFFVRQSRRGHKTAQAGLVDDGKERKETGKEQGRGRRRSDPKKTFSRAWPATTKRPIPRRRRRNLGLVLSEGNNRNFLFASPSLPPPESRSAHTVAPREERGTKEDTSQIGCCRRSGTGIVPSPFLLSLLLFLRAIFLSRRTIPFEV